MIKRYIKLNYVIAEYILLIYLPFEAYSAKSVLFSIANYSKVFHTQIFFEKVARFQKCPGS